MNITFSIIGVLFFLAASFGFFAVQLFKKNRELNRRLTAIKAELNGVLKRLKIQSEVAKMPDSEINENLKNYFRD